jgi:hypothetical protein
MLRADGATITVKAAKNYRKTGQLAHRLQVRRLSALYGILKTEING